MQVEATSSACLSLNSCRQGTPPFFFVVFEHGLLEPPSCHLPPACIWHVRFLQSMDATVTVCHSRTVDIAAHVRRADIVVAAIGKAEFVKKEWLKPGCVVIDVGINEKKDVTKKAGYRLVGDVDFDSAVEVSHIKKRGCKTVIYNERGCRLRDTIAMAAQSCIFAGCGASQQWTLPKTQPRGIMAGSLVGDAGAGWRWADDDCDAP